MVPKDNHILIPGTRDYVTLHGLRDFAGVKLRILRWGGDPELHDGPDAVTSILREVGRSESEKEM